MTKRKTKRNAIGSKAHPTFKISKDPKVQIFDESPFHTGDDRSAAAGMRRNPVLFAIARDPQTIFASWDVDWQAVFERAMPADRQVHLRVIDGGGAVKKTVAVEPMSGMHCVPTSGLRESCRLELGYFQPFSTWNSVVTSAEVEMSPHGSAAFSDVKLATIPFHLSFQQLVNLLGTADDTSTAKRISEFQKRLLNSNPANETTASDTKILAALNLSVPEIGEAERDYKNIDRKKLAEQTRARVRMAATSPVRGFQRNATADTVLAFF